MSNLFIIIQARMTSTRLKGKVLLPLCEKTVLEIMIDRLKDLKENIIIATTNDGTQELIVELCKKLKIKYYEGDTSNVLSRYYEAALKFSAKDDDIIVRCTSDCPLIDYNITKKTIEFFKSSKCDYISAGVVSGFPRGMDTEVFNFSLLKNTYLNAKDDYDKEHVTSYMYTKLKDKINIDYFKNSTDESKYRLTLDEEDDYLAIKEVYSNFDNQINFSYDELLTMLKENPYIYEINKHVEQKKI